MLSESGVVLADTDGLHACQHGVLMISAETVCCGYKESYTRMGTSAVWCWLQSSARACQTRQ